MKTKITDEYLYGTHMPTKVDESVIIDRVDSLNIELAGELGRHYKKRDNARVSAILKARDFWEGINNGN